MSTKIGNFSFYVIADYKDSTLNIIVPLRNRILALTALPDTEVDESQKLHYLPVQTVQVKEDSALTAIYWIDLASLKAEFSKQSFLPQRIDSISPPAGTVFDAEYVKSTTLQLNSLIIDTIVTKTFAHRFRNFIEAFPPTNLRQLFELKQAFVLLAELLVRPLDLDAGGTPQMHVGAGSATMPIISRQLTVLPGSTDSEGASLQSPVNWEDYVMEKLCDPDAWETFAVETSSADWEYVEEALSCPELTDERENLTNMLTMGPAMEQNRVAAKSIESVDDVTGWVVDTEEEDRASLDSLMHEYPRGEFYDEFSDETPSHHLSIILTLLAKQKALWDDAEFLNYVLLRVLQAGYSPLGKDSNDVYSTKSIVKLYIQIIAINLSTVWKESYPWDREGAVKLAIASVEYRPHLIAFFVEKWGADQFLAKLFTMPIRQFLVFFENAACREALLAQFPPEKLAPLFHRQFLTEDEFKKLMENGIKSHPVGLKHFLKILPQELLTPLYINWGSVWLKEDLERRYNDPLFYECAPKAALTVLFKQMGKFRLSFIWQTHNSACLKELIALEGAPKVIKQLYDKQVAPYVGKMQILEIEHCWGAEAGKDPALQPLNKVLVLIGAEAFITMLNKTIVAKDFSQHHLKQIPIQALQPLFIHDTIAANLACIQPLLWEKLLENEPLPKELALLVQEYLKDHMLTELLYDEALREKLASCLLRDPITQALAMERFNHFQVARDGQTGQLLRALLEDQKGLNEFLEDPLDPRHLSSDRFRRYCSFLSLPQKKEVVAKLQTPLAEIETKTYLLMLLPHLTEELLRAVYNFAIEHSHTDLQMACQYQFKERPDPTRADFLNKHLLVIIQKFEFEKLSRFMEQQIDINKTIQLAGQSWNTSQNTFPLHHLITHLLHNKEFEINRAPAQKWIVYFVEHLRASLDIPLYNDLGHAETLAEILLFYQGKHQEFARHLFLYLVRRGAKISDRMAYKMKVEITAKPVYEELLLAQGACTKQELDYLKEAASRPVHDATAQMLAGIETLKRLQRIATATPALLDYTQVEALKALKKSLKSHPERGELYVVFCQHYDVLITSSFALKQLQAISLEWRSLVAKAIKEPSLRLIRIYSLWARAHPLSSTEATQALSMIDAPRRKLEWRQIRIAFLADKIPPYLQAYPLSSVHGTKYSPYMRASASLLPKGEMVTDALIRAVPFSGELSGSEMGHNKHATSVSTLTANFEPLRKAYYRKSAYTEAPVNLIFDMPTSMGVSITYAMQHYGIGENEKLFNLEKTKARLTVATLSALLCAPADNPRARSVFLTDILRARAADPAHTTYLDPLLAWLKRDTLLDEIHMSVEDKTPEEKVSQITRHIAEFIKALTLPLAYSLTPDDMALLHHPIPILFGSTNLPYRDCYMEIDTKSLQHEALWDGEVKLGAQVQVAFTTKTYLETLTRLLEPLGVQVYSFEMAKLIETDRMMKGSLKLEATKGLPEGSCAYRQNKIASYINIDVLELYGRPLPEKATRVMGGKRVALKSHCEVNGMDYASYIRQVQAGHIIARPIHGKLHAIRTAIAAQLFLNLQPSKETDGSASLDTLHHDPFHLALTAAMHDVAREHDGEDFWDEESAQMLHSYFLSLGIHHETAKKYAAYIAHKDPADRVYKDTYHQALHNADVLEILRCIKASDFRKAELALDAEVPEAKLEALLAEWPLFIAVTESMRFEFDEDQGHYYQNVMSVLSHLKLPLISELLKEELAVFALRELPKNLHDRLISLSLDFNRFPT